MRSSAAGEGRSATSASAGSVDRPADPRIDPTGRWRSHAQLSYGVLGMYGFLIVIVLLVGRADSYPLAPNPIWLLAGLILLFGARYASTSYSIDSERLVAWRLFGSRAVPLAEIRRIELASLRELSPSSFFGGWGWRGRSWSPLVGEFDSIHTSSAGVLVYNAAVPLFVSPPDPAAFARELARRARSDHEGVELDLTPRGGAAAPAPRY